MDEGWRFFLDQVTAPERKGMTDGDWITLIAVSITLIVGILGYFRNPSFVSMGRVKGLRERMDELQSENEQLRSQVQHLSDAEWQLRRDILFWQDQYRKTLSNKSPLD